MTALYEVVNPSGGQALLLGGAEALALRGSGGQLR